MQGQLFHFRRHLRPEIVRAVVIPIVTGKWLVIYEDGEAELARGEELCPRDASSGPIKPIGNEFYVSEEWAQEVVTYLDFKKKYNERRVSLVRMFPRWEPGME